MENLESLKKELKEFTPERFNTVYRNLIDIAQTSDREYEILDALSFISSCNLMLEDVNETLKNFTDKTPEKQPGETHCLLCAAKEKTIQLLEKEVLSNKRVIEAQHKAIFGNNNHLTVCEK